MGECPKCGELVPSEARFCSRCGYSLGISGAGQVRKAVTSMFVDLVGSTELAQKLDAEPYRDILAHFFDAMASSVETHGGTVEKFIGDAIRATFGIPLVYEDDALRALRAAQTMRTRLQELNEGLDRRHGLKLELRIGVNTGELVVGGPVGGQQLLVGTATTIAARLQQAAEPGDILIGRDTYRLVKDYVEIEVVEVSVRGVAEPIIAYRLVSGPSDHGFQLKSLRRRLVDREPETAAIRSAFEDAVGSRKCGLLVLLGDPGIGKSRIAAEFASRVESRARVLTGRCLSYGEGITYWPIKEVIQQAAGIQSDDDDDAVHTKIQRIFRDTEGGRLVTRRLAQVLGADEGSAAPEEIHWAVRRLLEELARTGPLAVVLEDLHWAQSSLLELIGHVRQHARDAPIFLLCLARPEIPPRHFAGGVEGSLAMVVKPLSADHSFELMAEVAGAVEMSDHARRRVGEMAAGNPLFIEQTLSMLMEESGADAGTGRASIEAAGLEAVPLAPSIQMILASRLDRLGGRERAALECLSVAGLEASAEAVRHLLGGNPERTLGSLTKKEFVEPARGGGYRFCHGLIRDAVYRSTSKSRRATLHEGFASWMEDTLGPRISDYAEIVGHHFEQAFLLRRELAARDPSLEELAVKAARRLAAAGTRAHAHDDMEAVKSLVERAKLLYEAAGQKPLDIFTVLGDALIDLRDMGGCERLTRESEEISRRTGDRRFEAYARWLRSWIEIRKGPGYSTADAIQEAKEVIELCDRLGDVAGSARGLHYLTWGYVMAGLNALAVDSGRAASALAQEAGSAHDEAWSREITLDAMVIGPTPVSEALAEVEESLRWSKEVSNRRMQSVWFYKRAELEAMLGRERAARASLSAGQAIVHDLGPSDSLLVARCFDAFEAHVYLDMVQLAEEELVRCDRVFVESDEASIAASVKARLAELLASQGRYEEAEFLTEESENATSSDDPDVHLRCRMNRARIAAQRGHLDEAEELAIEACTLADTTDWLNLRGKARWLLGQVQAAQDRADADRQFTHARRLFEKKENALLAGMVKPSLTG